MQELLCMNCAKRVMGYPDDLDPGYNSSFIEGTVIKRVPGFMRIKEWDTGETLDEIIMYETICDSCGTLQEVGTLAIGWTMWPAGKEKPVWEHEMLKDLHTRKEVIRGKNS